MGARNCVTAVELAGQTIGLGACDVTEQNILNGDPWAGERVEGK